jgi:ATP-dependent RNA helicase DDX52/ROK1
MEEILLRGIKRKRKSRKSKTEASYRVEGRSLPQLDAFTGLDTKVPFESPLLIQKLVIPYFFGHVNVVVRSFTGSGKTLAYALPLVEMAGRGRLFAVVLVPSTALVRQVFRVVDEIRNETLEVRGVYEDSSGMVCLRENAAEHRMDDGSSAEESSGGKRRVLITTPETLVKMEIKLRKVTHLVIDEADVLVNTESLTLFSGILELLRIEKVHFSCFSATMNDEVEEIVGSFNEATRILVESSRPISHKFVFGTDERIKHLALLQLLREGVECPVLIFVGDVRTGEKLRGMVERSAVYDEKQRGSTEILDDFRLKRTWFLFTTDVLGRGVDFYNVRSVINYDLPATKTHFVHRVGRINRNCSGQSAYTIYIMSDFRRLRIIAEFLDENKSEVPEHIRRIINRS